MNISDRIRAVALGPAPKARGGSPLSSWLRHDGAFSYARRFTVGQFFTVLSTTDQRVLLLLIAEEATVSKPKYAGKALVAKRIDKAVKRAEKRDARPKRPTPAQLLRKAKLQGLTK